QMIEVKSNKKVVALDKNKHILKINFRKMFRLVLNIIVAIIVLFPLIYAVSMSLKPPNEIYSQTPSIFTANPTLQNYKDVLDMAPIGLYILNSFLVSTIIMVSQIGTAIIAAFAFHFLRFRMKAILFAIIMS